MKKTTAALLLVILAVSTLSAALATTATAKPENVRILSYSWYTYPASSYDEGYLIVVGEVQNVGTTNLDNVRLQGIAYTTDGQPQADSMCGAFVENMLPQQKAPFYMYFDVNSAYWGNMTWMNMVDHVDLSVVYANDTDTQPDTNLVLWANTSYADPGRSGLYTVTGIIKNTGTQPSPNMVWAVTTFYDASGTVVGVNETASPYMKTALAANETFSFTATPDDYSQITRSITGYSIIVQSRQIATATPTPSPVATQSANPSATTTPQSSGQQTNSPQTSPAQTSGSSQEWLYAVVGAVAGAAAVIVVMVVLRKKK